MKEEESLTESICSFLNYKCKGAQINRIIPSGYFRDGKMRRHRSENVKKGVSDILMMYAGTFYAFEIKTPRELKYVLKYWDKIKAGHYLSLNKKQRHIKAQIDYLSGIRNNGGKGGFVCSFEQVREIIDGSFSESCFIQK